MRDTAFYQDHLDRVSRSFAFCIRELPDPMRGWVSLSYLLCRVLDTVEDAPWDSAARRDREYAQFDVFLGGKFTVQDVAMWVEAFPSNLPEGEKALLRDAASLFEDLGGLQPPVREAIRGIVNGMSIGMQHYAEQQTLEGELRLPDIKEVNRYCYFVAGIVGQLLTRLFMLHRPDFTPNPSLLKNAFHFGLFLQKINILKDQRVDEGEGRFLVPDRDEVLRSLAENARGSVDYLTALPVEERGYRIFCAWALFLGAASLPVIRAARPTDLAPKIDRATLALLLSSVSGIIDDNAALRDAMEQHLASLPAERDGTPPRDDWFRALSGDALRPSELSELHVL